MEGLRKVLLLLGIQNVFRNNYHLLDDEQTATTEKPKAPKGHRPIFCMWLSREEVTLNSGCDHDNVLGVLHALQNTVQLLEVSVIQQWKRHTLYRQIFLPMSTVAAWLGVVCRLACRFLWGCPGRCI